MEIILILVKDAFRFITPIIMMNMLIFSILYWLFYYLHFSLKVIVHSEEIASYDLAVMTIIVVIASILKSLFLERRLWMMKHE